MLDLEIRPTDNPAVKVAKDVLQQLDGLQLKRQTFGVIVLPLAELPEDGDLKTQIIPKLRATCPTCLKGTCILSMAHVLDRPLAYGHEDIIDNGYRRISLGDYINAPKRYLGVFDHRTWHMMEAAFEMAPGIPSLHRVPDDEAMRLLPYLLAAAHFGRQIKDDYIRVRDVMANVIQNNGQFLLEPIMTADHPTTWWNEHYGPDAWTAQDVVPTEVDTVAQHSRRRRGFHDKVLGANPWEISEEEWIMREDRDYFTKPEHIVEENDEEEEDDDYDDEDVDTCGYCGSECCEGECQDEDAEEDDDEDWEEDDDDDFDDEDEDDD